MRRVANDKRDFLQEFVNCLREERISFCIVGGLAVNAYAEPVVSLDLDVVVPADRLKDFLALLKGKYKIKKFPNSINISAPYSDLRIQIQTDPRYQEFIGRAKDTEVLGYRLPVAAIEDVLQGKIWAVQDETRRMSKRQKDLTDILRLVETNRHLISLLPNSIRRKLSLSWREKQKK